MVIKMNLGYIAKVIGGLKIDRIKECVETVHEKSGKNKALTLLDMISCTVKYGAGFHDYTIFEYYNMNAAQRKTYMTRIKNKKLMLMMNDASDAKIFDFKNEFYHHFAKYIGRDFLDLTRCTKEDIVNFVNEKKYIIAKPSEGECGHGIEKIDLSAFNNTGEIYEYITDKAKKFGVIEDVLEQHQVLSNLYPHSINCFRIVTLVHEGVPHVLYAVLKTGNNGNFVDNLESGGFACHFDLNKGEISGPGHTSKLDVCEIHPATGVKFKGYKVPYVKEAMELVKAAALEVPSVKYVGWDVCITPTGPAIIEGNNYAAYDFPQLPDEGMERRGLLAQIHDIGIKL